MHTKTGATIDNTIVVLSGKGGVGKSTVATNLAFGLAMQGLDVGLLDADLHGPSVPVLLGLQDRKVRGTGTMLEPIKIGDLKIMSIGFLLREQDDAVIWRGPRKTGVIKQFIEDVDWGHLDYLIVDSPPGTGDEPLSVLQTIEQTDGAIIVTTPQEVAAADVRKSVNFCNTMNIKVIGIVENMAGFACPHCGEVTHIFKSGGGLAIAEQFGVPYLASIPISPEVGIAGDEGLAFIRKFEDSPASKAFMPVIHKFLIEHKMKKDKADEAAVMH